ncbi:protein of unknown function (plasmid) [Cupriavidus taiwanensis]|uniref:Uncharacterized protein n=1 Tax=Cupriavidus taiwanensis TaxID=164546 RepID=A0A375IMW9_9BURK|nr:protein of unknown function [Cupriavidus taiwanensis]
MSRVSHTNTEHFTKNSFHRYSLMERLLA